MPDGDIKFMLTLGVSAIGICVILGAFSGIPVSHWISEKMTSFFLGFSAEKFAKPQPLIGNAAAKAMKGDIHGAMVDYETMLKEHPKNAELYLRLMELAYGPLQHHDYGDQIMARGLKTVESAKERTTLQRLGTALKEGHLITHRHLGWLNNLERGIQPPLLQLGEAALVGTSKKK